MQEWAPEKERSEYRNVDESHPSKAIEIFSDSCFHKNPHTRIIYDIFKDEFDGTMHNNCAADIFHCFRPYFAPNYLLLRHIEGNRNMYLRLDFELRILNSKGETLDSTDYGKLYTYQSAKDEQSQSAKDEQSFEFSEIESASLQQHNVVLSSFENYEKAVYLIENYIQYYCISDSEIELETNNPQLSIFLIVKGLDEQKVSLV